MARSLLPELLDRPFSRLAGLGQLSQVPFFSNLQNCGLEDSLLPNFACHGVRVFEEGNDLRVEVPVPGLTCDQIEVSINRGVLFVKGQSCEEEECEERGRRYYQQARRDCSRSIVLPTQVDEKQEMQASLENGILNITLRLARQAETTKIPVRAGAGAQAGKRPVRPEQRPERTERPER